MRSVTPGQPRQHGQRVQHVVAIDDARIARDDDVVGDPDRVEAARLGVADHLEEAADLDGPAVVRNADAELPSSPGGRHRGLGHPPARSAYLMLTGALASNGLQRPSSLPISRTAGSTSWPSSRMQVLRVLVADEAVAGPEARGCDGRVSSRSRRSFGMHRLRRAGDDLLVADLVLEGGAARVGARGPTANSTKAWRYDGEK